MARDVEQLDVLVRQLQGLVAPGMLLELAVTGARREVALGTGIVVFSAADSSAELAVAHGLGAVPVGVWCGARAPAVARLTIQETTQADVTNFYVKGFQTQGTAISVSQTFYWLAIG